MSNFTKEEMCQQLHEFYGWNLKELLKQNESQISILYAACKDEDGELRKPINE